MLGRMRFRGDIQTFEDEGFLRRVAQDSAAAFVIGLGATLVFGIVLAMFAPGLFDGLLSGIFAADGRGFIDYVLWIAWVAVATAASFIAHELVHGIFFKAFAPAGARVTFGANWKRGMLYASAEGVIYTRAQYLVIALAPTFVVTAALIAAGFACGCPVAGAFAATLHLSGCAGDWEYVREIAADPLITHCEDTASGVRFFGADDAGDEAAGDEPAAPGADAHGEVRP